MKTAKQNTCEQNFYRKMFDKGLVNSLINKRRVQLHLPCDYQVCGSRAKFEKKLGRKDSGVNPLDVACKAQDIVYTQNPNNLSSRHRANNHLEQITCHTD